MSEHTPRQEFETLVNRILDIHGQDAEQQYISPGYNQRLTSYLKTPLGIRVADLGFAEFRADWVGFKDFPIRERAVKLGGATIVYVLEGAEEVFRAQDTAMSVSRAARNLFGSVVTTVRELDESDVVNLNAWLTSPLLTASPLGRLAQLSHEEIVKVSDNQTVAEELEHDLAEINTVNRGGFIPTGIATPLRGSDGASRRRLARR